MPMLCTTMSCALLAIATVSTDAAPLREGPAGVAGADPHLKAPGPPAPVYPHYLLFSGTNIAGAQAAWQLSPVLGSIPSSCPSTTLRRQPESLRTVCPNV